MRTFTEFKSDNELEEANDIIEVDASRSDADEINESIEDLQELIYEDLGWKFTLTADITDGKIEIKSDDLIKKFEEHPEKYKGKEVLAKLMYKKLFFDGICESIIEHPDGEKTVTMTPRMAFKNEEDGTFYQNVGTGAYIYDFKKHDWTMQ